MKTATVSDFRTNMKERLNEVQRDQDVLILSGPKNKDFVLITLEAYNSMEETAHLLSTPANAARLIESIAQDKAGKVAQSFTVKPDDKTNAEVRGGKKPNRHGRTITTTVSRRRSR